jgi:hypothetical protein
MGEESQGLSSKSPDQESAESAVSAPAAGGGAMGQDGQVLATSNCLSLLVQLILITARAEKAGACDID